MLHAGIKTDIKSNKLNQIFFSMMPLWVSKSHDCGTVPESLHVL